MGWARGADDGCGEDQTKPEAGHRVAAHGTRTHSEGPTVEGASSLALVEGVVGLLPHWGMGGLSAVADAGTKDGMAWQDVLEMEMEMEMEMDFWGWIDRCLPSVYAMCIGFSRWYTPYGCHGRTAHASALRLFCYLSQEKGATKEAHVLHLKEKKEEPMWSLALEPQRNARRRGTPHLSAW